MHSHFCFAENKIQRIYFSCDGRRNERMKCWTFQMVLGQVDKNQIGEKLVEIVFCWIEKTLSLQRTRNLASLVVLVAWCRFCLCMNISGGKLSSINMWWPQWADEQKTYPKSNRCCLLQIKHNRKSLAPGRRSAHNNFRINRIAFYFACPHGACLHKY